MEDLFEFTLPDGSKANLTIHGARSFGCKHMNKRADEIVDYLKSKNKVKHKKDGFVPGWQENIRMYITCPHQYRKALKELGLVEIGNDYIPQDTTKVSNPFENEELIKAAVQSGLYLSGREIEALKSGEYFKDLKHVDDGQ
jgi:hypothetical protein